MPTPQNAPVRLTRATAGRFGQAATFADDVDRSGVNQTPQPAAGDRQQPPPAWVVRVTGAVLSSGLYPAVCREFDMGSGSAAWQDAAGEDECYAYHVTGAALAEGDISVGLFVGEDLEDGRSVFAVGSAGGGGSVTTANTDGTEESTTSRLEFDQNTGVRVDAGATDADPDTVSLVAATATQWGAVTTSGQVWSGVKRVVNAVQVTPTATGYTVVGSLTPTEAGCEHDEPADIDTYGFRSSVFADDFSDDTAGYHYTACGATAGGREVDDYLFATYVGLTTYSAAGGLIETARAGLSFLNGYRVRGIAGGILLDFYVDVDEATNDDSAFAPVWDYPVRHQKNLLVDDGFTHGAKRSGVDWFGGDADVAIGTTTLRFRGGHFIDSFTTGSPPPPPPPAPSPPPFAPNVIQVSGPSGRDVTVGSDTQTLSGAGAATFYVADGTYTVTLDSAPAETATWSVNNYYSGPDSGSGYTTDSFTLEFATHSLADVGFLTAGVISPPPPPP